VLKGTWVYELDGQPPVTVKAGEVLFIPDGVVHSARNIGTDVGIELATYILRKANRFSRPRSEIGLSVP
jgi:quercetin dioxygenase-like cupin family protein